MRETVSGDFISEQELRDATGIDRHSLRRVRKWLFLDFDRKFPGRGTGGSVTYYPRSALPTICRFRELRRETRKIDECVWRLWIEGFPIDILKWALARLAPNEALIATAAGDDIENVRKQIIEASSVKPSRTNAGYPIHGRLGSNAANSLLYWAIDIIAGLTPAKSLDDPSSPPFDALKKAGGLIGDWPPPDPELSVESLSIPHLCEILRNASTDEVDQARRDWAMIAQLVDGSGAIDWRSIRKALHVERTSSAQPIAPADFLIALWHDFDARAVLLAGLIHVRSCSPDHSHKLSEILALAQWALAQFSQHTEPTP